MGRFSAAWLCLVLWLAPGCVSRMPAPPIQHVMLFQLSDPSEARDLSRDAFQLMQAPVQTLVTGPRIEGPRAPASGERIDAGITAMFNSVEDYRAFADHPATGAFMARWRARSVLVQTATYGPTCDPVDAAR